MLLILQCICFTIKYEQKLFCRSFPFPLETASAPYRCVTTQLIAVAASTMEITMILNKSLPMAVISAYVLEQEVYSAHAQRL